MRPSAPARLIAAAGSLALLGGAIAACGGPRPAALSRPRGGEGVAAPLDVAIDASRAWRKTRASLRPGAETVFYWSGEIYALEDRAPPAPSGREPPLFRFEGFNVARILEADGHPVLVSREASFYEDPTTGDVLRCWESRWAPEPGPRGRRVLHVWNDPVSFPLAPPPHDAHGDRVSFATTLVLAYPSPLAARPDLLPYSAGDVYRGAESFQFFVSRADLADPRQESVPVDVAWTRVGPWLPWMRLAGSSMRLLYAAHGHKLARYEDLPLHVRRFVRGEGKERYEHAPVSLAPGPNATSWRYFAEEVGARRYVADCP